MEIERKFLIKKENLPENLASYPCHRIEQGYLCTSPVVRIPPGCLHTFFLHQFFFQKLCSIILTACQSCKDQEYKYGKNKLNTSDM